MADADPYGFVALPSVGEQRMSPAPQMAPTPGDETGFVPMPPTQLAPEDRRWLAETLPGSQGYNEQREALEAKYGGAEALDYMLDPTAAFMGRKVMPPALTAATMIGAPELLALRAAPLVAKMGPTGEVIGWGLRTPAGLAATNAAKAAGGKLAEGAKVAMKNPIVKDTATWLGRGALGATGWKALQRLIGDNP